MDAVLTAEQGEVARRHWASEGEGYERAGLTAREGAGRRRSRRARPELATPAAGLPGPLAPALGPRGLSSSVLARSGFSPAATGDAARKYARRRTGAPAILVRVDGAWPP